MKTVVNFSHPLQAEARLQLEAKIGEFEERLLTCQINFDQPIQAQLMRLVESAWEIIEDVPEVFFIPPALSFASAFVTAKMPLQRSSMIILKPTGIVRQFVLADIVSLS